MSIDLVTWSVWLVGFAIFIIWIWIPARELRTLLKDRQIQGNKKISNDQN